MKQVRKCKFCGKEFVARNGMQKYCCEECQTKAKEARKKRQQDFTHAVEPVIGLQNQEYLTFAKAAILMGCSRQYVYKLVNEGKLERIDTIPTVKEHLSRQELITLANTPCSPEVLKKAFLFSCLTGLRKSDMSGNINDAHFIGERAMKVAAIINRRRGWKDPMQIREEHIQQIAGDCMDVLRRMPEFNWWSYEAELKKRGYEVKLNRDSMGEVRGYSIKMGNSSYKASELSRDRRLLASHLYRTWVLLHEQYEEPVTESRRTAQPQQVTKAPIIPVPLPRKKDEDDEEWARRCARKAAWLCKPMRRTFKR